jgi:hypothetical protein
LPAPPDGARNFRLGIWPLRLWDQLGYLVSDDFAIGILSLVIAALYPIPRTSVLGANPPDWLALRRDSHAPARG